MDRRRGELVLVFRDRVTPKLLQNGASNAVDVSSRE